MVSYEEIEQCIADIQQAYDELSDEEFQLDTQSDQESPTYRELIGEQLFENVEIDALRSLFEELHSGTDYSLQLLLEAYDGSQDKHQKKRYLILAVRYALSTMHQLAEGKASAESKVKVVLIILNQLKSLVVNISLREEFRKQAMYWVEELMIAESLLFSGEQNSIIEGKVDEISEKLAPSDDLMDHQIRLNTLKGVLYGERNSEHSDADLGQAGTRIAQVANLLQISEPSTLLEGQEIVAQSFQETYNTTNASTKTDLEVFFVDLSDRLMQYTGISRTLYDRVFSVVRDLASSPSTTALKEVLGNLSLAIEKHEQEGESEDQVRQLFCNFWKTLDNLMKPCSHDELKTVGSALRDVSLFEREFFNRHDMKTIVPRMNTRIDSKKYRGAFIGVGDMTKFSDRPKFKNVLFPGLRRGNVVVVKASVVIQ
jgi:hypothetical protein